MRSRNSAAAASVKVMATRLAASRTVPVATSRTTRSTSTRVFPVPAPASTNRLRCRSSRMRARLSWSTSSKRVIVGERHVTPPSPTLLAGVVGLLVVTRFGQGHVVTERFVAAQRDPLLLATGRTQLVVRAVGAVVMGLPAARAPPLVARPGREQSAADAVGHGAQHVAEPLAGRRRRSDRPASRSCPAGR